jgi:hypothetical protein
MTLFFAFLFEQAKNIIKIFKYIFKIVKKLLSRISKKDILLQNQ